jgi:LPS-assembly lipoprotein
MNRLGVPVRILFLLAASALAGCGFELRGARGAVLAPELAALRVTAAGALSHPPVLIEVREALRTHGGVRVVEEAGTPTLTLLEETIESELLATDGSGRATDHLLNYRLSFALSDAGGREWLAPQAIRLQREFRLDRLNVLAKDREEDLLRREMRRDAVEQLLRRLAAFAPR